MIFSTTAIIFIIIMIIKITIIISTTTIVIIRGGRGRDSVVILALARQRTARGRLGSHSAAGFSIRWMLEVGGPGVPQSTLLAMRIR